MQEQSEVQGILDKRINHLNKFRVGMADIAMHFSAIAQSVTVIFMKKTRDVYNDTSVEEEFRVEKRAVVSKSPDMNYVQDLFDVLLEEEDKQPWLVKLTISSLPRLINHDDRIVIAGQTYSVSLVSPINRLNDGIQKILVYPERSEDNE